MTDLRGLRLRMLDYVRDHRGLYLVAVSCGMGGICCGWSMASRMSASCIRTLSVMLMECRESGDALSPAGIFLSSQVRWALLLGWMILASLSRLTWPVPLAVVFLQCFACGMTVHALALVETGFIAAVEMLAAYGIMVVLSLPVLWTGAVLSMEHAAKTPLPARSRRYARSTKSNTVCMIRNMVFLFVCGVPASCARCLLGLTLR